MSTQTFPCPFCGRRMGVGIELLGKHVRCPHCKQVILAPSTPTGPVPPKPIIPPPVAPPPEPVVAKPEPPKPAPPAPVQPPASVAPPPAPANPFAFDTAPPSVAPAAPAPPVAPPPPPEEPAINFPQKELADSILSAESESEDEVFGSHSSSKLPTPVLPDPEPPPPAASAPPPVASGSPTVAPQPVSTLPPMLLPSELPTVELRKPAVLDAVPPPARPAPHPVPPTAPAIPNPFVGFDAAPAPAPAAPKTPTPPPRAAEPAPLPLGEQPEADEPAPKPARAARGRRAAPASGAPKGLLYALAGYALLATALAVYGLFFKSGDGLTPGHPLSTIPDNFGEFDPASRKKVSQYKFPVDGELPAALKAGLGGKIEVGQLEIEPLGVEKRRLRIVTERLGAAAPERRDGRSNALVLRLKVKNTSADVPIFPLDPAFTRTAKGDDKPATRLIVGKQTLYGGAIPWPFARDVKREYEEAQATDYEPLKPGETREYVVFTNEDSGLAPLVRKTTESLLWRVQVRRGLVAFKGKDVPVTAVIGVEFKASDVKNLE
jgi:hypothetical protein